MMTKSSSNPSKGNDTPRGNESMPSNSMPSKTSNESIKEMLLKLRSDIQALYPFTTENSEPDIDTRYCFALGAIFGIAHEGLESVRQNRTIHLSNMGFKEAVIKNPGALISLEGDEREGNEP